MRLEYIDWSILRGAVITLLSCFVITVFMATTSWYLKNEMQLRYEKEKNQFRSVSQRYLEVDNEVDLVDKYIDEFMEYYERGILGTEKRLNWVEVLNESGEEIKIPHLRYEIATQDEFIPDFDINLKNFKVFSSEMKITAELLHEGDLFNLLDSLNKRAKGLYSISDCKLTRLSNEIEENVSRGNIITECNLDWFNIRQSSGDEIHLL